MAWAIGNFKVLWLDSFLRYHVVQTLCLSTSSLFWFNFIDKQFVWGIIEGAH